jgi:hypothetical protein
MGLPDNRREADSSYCAKALEAWSWWVAFRKPSSSKSPVWQTSACRYGWGNAQFLAECDCLRWRSQFRLDGPVCDLHREYPGFCVRSFSRRHLSDLHAGLSRRYRGACHASPKQLIAIARSAEVQSAPRRTTRIFTGIPGMRTYRSRTQSMAGARLLHAVGSRKRGDDCHALCPPIEPGLPFERELGVASVLPFSRSIAVHRCKVGFAG